MIPALGSAQRGMVINVVEEFGGMYRPGKWYPVVVSIDNRLADGGNPEAFQGTISIQSTTFSDRQPNIDFIREVNVPPSANQRFILLTRLRSGIDSRNLVVRTSGGRMVQTIPLNLSEAPSNKIMLVTAQTQPRRINYPAPRISSANPYIQAVMATSTLPDHWAAYDSVDVLSFPAWPESPVSSIQANALIQWVSMGGTLAFLGGSGTSSYASAGASPLLPAEVGTSTSYRFDPERRVLVPHSPTGGQQRDEVRSFLVTELTPRPGAEVLLAVPDADGNEVPLLIRRREGTGRILFSALDFDVLPDGLRQMVEGEWLGNIPLPNMLPPEAELPQSFTETGPPPTRRAAQPPNLLLVLLIALAYVVVVGPVNFVLLSKKGRIQWAWFTVPAIVFVFSSLIYTLGTWSKGTRTVVRETAILWGAENEVAFRERSFVAAFTHRPDNASIEPLDSDRTASDSAQWVEANSLYRTSGFLSLGGRQSSGALGISSSTPQVVQTSTNPTMRNWRMRTYDIATLELRGPRMLDGPVNSTLRYRSSGNTFWLDGELANNTGLDFSKAFLVWGRGAMLFSEPIASGDSVALSRLNSAREFGDLRGRWESRAAVLASLNATTFLEDSPEDYHRNASRIILESLMTPSPYSNVLPPYAGKLLFVGIVDHEEPSFTTGLNASVITRSSIVVVELNPAPEPGEAFDLPGDLVHFALQDSSVGTGSYFQWGGFGGRNPDDLLMRDSVATFNVRLPFESPGLQVTDVQFLVDAAGGGTRQQMQPRLYSLRDGSFLGTNVQFAAGVANRGVFVGRNATGWVELLVNDPEADGQQRAPTFSPGSTEELRVRSLGLRVRGRVDP